ncbi:ABC transporter permease [Nonomuraea sp. SYSU D8015]|uniref:ABC transporter permease n=1 Tax=Nonomuraea sp. SYSU D8015 TaxID=2593644 RepID=UPI001660BF3E|nr:ABC transporter permease [Nonomuraea sp. SYSU D8015]
MKILAIALLNLRRLFRDRSNIFFVIVVPFLMIFMMGLLFGGGQQHRLGVVGADSGPLAQRLSAALGTRDDIEVVPMGSEEDLRTAVERGQAQAGVMIPGSYDADLRAGRQVQVRYLVRPDDWQALDVGSWVRSTVPKEAALLYAAGFAAAEDVTSFDDGLRRAEAARLPGVEVKVSTIGRTVFPEGFSQFNLAAPPLLLLYTFLTSMTAAIGLVETRLSGVSARMYSTPTTARAIVLGETAGRLVIALFQGLLIMLGSALLFQVEWGDPLGAAALLTVFSAIGAGAAMLLASFFRTVGPVVSLSAILGLGLAAVGGTMVPLESFSGVMWTVAHFTPHAWGYEGFVTLVRHGGGIGDILPQLGVLTAFALVLLPLGVWAQRRAITR